MVYQLAQRLPQGVPHVIYMDNLFTRVPVRKLRTLNIGACGTTRRHPEFPAFLLELKDLCSKYLLVLVPPIRSNISQGFTFGRFATKHKAF